MDQPSANLLVKIEAPGLDNNELEDLARLLREDIETLDVGSVEPVKGGDVPEGAMAGEWIQIGSFLVKLTKGLIRPLLKTIESWLKRQGARRIETTSESNLEIKIQIGELSIVVNKSNAITENVIKAVEDHVPA